ncbi:hypothetical protein BUALT_Bualt09G0083200 [Buddleja alternifolia]|uniref:Uncharacterized protein n=1 Tax=Buddleja alternifolia TaxID=168488 RepID=A0AAV6XBR6_9LAMI|nr:hypothetical protein BUALT_Bualt09G0083200 [Buddleja alternifolia]
MEPEMGFEIEGLGQLRGEEMVVRCEGLRWFTRFVFKSNDEESEMDNENLGNLRDTVIVEVDGLMREKLTVLSSPNVRKMEMKMSKKKVEFSVYTRNKRLKSRMVVIFIIT